MAKDFSLPRGLAPTGFHSVPGSRGARFAAIDPETGEAVTVSRRRYEEARDHMRLEEAQAARNWKVTQRGQRVIYYKQETPRSKITLDKIEGQIAKVQSSNTGQVRLAFHVTLENGKQQWVSDVATRQIWMDRLSYARGGDFPDFPGAETFLGPRRDEYEAVIRFARITFEGKYTGLYPITDVDEMEIEAR